MLVIMQILEKAERLCGLVSSGNIYIFICEKLKPQTNIYYRKKPVCVVNELVETGRSLLSLMKHTLINLISFMAFSLF